MLNLFRGAAPLLTVQAVRFGQTNSLGPGNAFNATGASGPRDKDLVYICGRPSGFVGFVLNLMRLNATTEFHFGSDRVQVRQANLAGETTVMFPLNRISSVICGYRRNPVWLVIAGFILFLGLGFIAEEAVITVVAVILAIVLTAGYFLNRRLILAISNGSESIVLAMKEATIGNGVTVDRDMANRVAVLVNDRLAQDESRA